MDILKEAQRLYELGWAVHWIRPNSKAPVKTGWSGSKRDNWQTVLSDYKKGYGLGVRLGEASSFHGNYLANIDIDLKSMDPKDRQQALDYVDSIFPNLRNKAPTVKTDHGIRLFVTTDKPYPSGKLRTSPKECIVRLPTSEINRRQLLAVKEGKLTKKQLDEGYRVRPAWEVEFMSIGKQVVLPPSIHPETKKPYVWDWSKFIHPPGHFILPPIIPPAFKKSDASTTKGMKFTPVEVELEGRLLESVIQTIVNGKGVTDRSAACFGAAIAMHKAGFTDDEILSVLTDRSYVLGETAYDHRKTDSRNAAAAWAYDYCLVKAKREASATAAFETEVEVAPEFETEEEAKAQVKALVGEHSGLDRGNGGGIKQTLKNALYCLRHIYGPHLFRRNLFTGACTYGVEVPWGGKVGEEFKDLHRPLLTEWFARTWGFEPNPNCIFDAISVIASQNAFHPIKDYLEGLIWDGTPRIKSWMKDYLHVHDVNETYLENISRIMLVAMVKRVMEPGCKFDHMVILCGKQGTKKSTALSVLAGDEHFSSTILTVGDKDSILKMQGKWIIEFGELSTLKADVRALKNFLTTATDRERIPYDHMPQDFRRSGIFAGSTNQDDFLADDTGDRRFWPVKIRDIDIKGLRKARDQLFAEAFVMWGLGEPIYLSEKVEELAKVEQARWRPDEDVMVEKIDKLLRHHKTKEDLGDKLPQEGFTLHEIMARIEGKEDMQTQKRVGRALRILGFESRSARMKWDTTFRKRWFKIVTPVYP